MANLTRWDPYREMMSFRRFMDRFFEDNMMNEGSEWDQQTRWQVPVDLTENEDSYMIKASLPGISPEDLNITYNNGVLSIQAETRDDKEIKEDRYLVRERRYGTFARSISLPATINADAIEASYDAGILTLRLPKTEEVKPKRIQVRNGQRMIEGNSSKR